MPLIDIPKDARKGKAPCGECHLSPGEVDDICGASHSVTIAVWDAPCEHDFQGWREFADGRGGETVCTKCGVGAMSCSLWTGI